MPNCSRKLGALQSHDKWIEIVNMVPALFAEARRVHSHQPREVAFPPSRSTLMPRGPWYRIEKAHR
ncbi:hypothetical protein PsorP6_013475 [Peronosclerospora sorghi]|uniref:Uncharacterized protein n=1 Tax=Peronosclerospora sorghi TaxID=230839 RepID=A0ACC0VJF7_9STRA|nr:hypothetical protein PsorP6_013475 [Peronosclerospora sorghi]